MILGVNAYLKMNVGLYHSTQERGKVNYHSEFSYLDSNMNKMMNSVKRNFDYYLSIENFSSTETAEKEFIRIGIMEMPLLINGLNMAAQWFLSQEFNGLFYQTKDTLRIMGNAYDPVVIESLPMGKVLRLEPVVVMGYENNQFPGIRLFINSQGNYVDMLVNKFMGFKYFMETTNIFLLAQVMLNYLQRPDFGTNSFMITNKSEAQPPQVLGNTGIQGRKIGLKSNSLENL